MSKSVADVLVLEIGAGIAAGYTGKLLADAGARVLKIEPPAGDVTRHIGPYPDDVPDPQVSGTYASLHAGKGSVVADPSTQEGVATLRRLLPSAGVVICGATHRSKGRALLDASRIHREYPSAIVVDMKPFGDVPGFENRPVDELTLQAVGGISLGIGSYGRPPLRLPGEQSAYQAGLCGAIAAASALVEDRGGLIDIAAVDVWATLYNGGEVANDYFGRKKPPRAGYRVSRQPYLRAIFPCKDGYFAIQCSETRHWTAFLSMVGREDLLEHPLFVNRLKANDDHAEQCDAFFAPWFEGRSKQEILERCLRAKIPGTPVYTIGEVVEHPHLHERGYFRDVTAGDKTLRTAGHPFKIAKEESERQTTVPRLGEHRADWTSAAIEHGANQQVVRRSPLEGIRVVDFGWVWAGAIPGHILADLGAEVIRIEGKKPLDFMRQGRPIVGTEKDPEQNPVFQNVNRGKLSVCLDLNQPEASALARELIATSDVVIENFSPGVMDRFGLAWSDLHALRADLIMCSMSAAGQSGPLHGIRTYAAMIASLAGLNSMVGYPGERVLGIQAPPYADPNAGLHAAFAILMALAARTSDGKGRYIDLSQWEAAVSLMGPQVMDYVMNGRSPGTCGTGGGSSAPYGHYPVAGVDKWIALAVTSDMQWSALCQVLGDPPWMRQPMYATPLARVGSSRQLDHQLAEETTSRDGEELARRLRAAGVPAEVLVDVGDILAHPYFSRRELFELVDHPTLNRVPVYRLPWRVNGRPIPVRRRAPALGEHTVEVLQSLLGKSGAELADLRARGIVY